MSAGNCKKFQLPHEVEESDSEEDENLSEDSDQKRNDFFTLVDAIFQEGLRLQLEKELGKPVVWWNKTTGQVAESSFDR
jgi:hypothetical protein